MAIPLDTPSQEFSGIFSGFPWGFLARDRRAPKVAHAGRSLLYNVFGAFPERPEGFRNIPDENIFPSGFFTKSQERSRKSQDCSEMSHSPPLDGHPARHAEPGISRNLRRISGIFKFVLGGTQHEQEFPERKSRILKQRPLP